MKLRVLGAAAGGAFPQWNCACNNCQLARTGSPRVTPRTEDSLAVSRDGESWFVLNASPQIQKQLAGFSSLWPRAGRGSPIAGIVLTNGDLDHVLGLFSLRESTPLVVYATASVFQALREKNIMMRTLERFDGQLTFRQLTLGKETPLLLRSGEPSGLSLVAHAAPGKVPVHLAGTFPSSQEDNISVSLREDDDSQVATYATAVAALEPGSALLSELERASLVFFDGTFWRDDELIALGLGKARARDMAHIPIAGENGSLAVLGGLRARKVYMHINNTNPILDETSQERGLVTKAGWEVATDGMELSL